MPGVRQLLFAVGHLLLRIRQLLLGIGNLLLAVGKVPLALGIVHPALLVVPLALLIVGLAVGQLPVGVVQLIFRVGLLPMVVLPAVRDFLLGIGDRLHGLGVDVVVALLRPLVHHVLHRRLHFVPPGVVGVGVCLAGIGHGQVDFVIDLKVEPLLGDIHIGGHAAAAHGAGAPLEIEVGRGPGQSHDRIALAAQKLPGVLTVVPGYRQGPAQHILGKILGVPQALVGLLRHPSRRQGGEVHILRQGMGPDHRLIALPEVRQEIGVHCPPGGLHSLQGGEGRRILLRKAQAGQQPEVVQPLLVQIVHSGSHHGRLAGPEAGEEAHSQAHDG